MDPTTSPSLWSPASTVATTELGTPSQAAVTLSTMGNAIGHKDEMRSIFGASIDGEELESDSQLSRVGMEFNSEVAAISPKSKSTKGDAVQKTEMRTGCDAKIKCMANDGKWKISMAFLKHNHDLNGCLAGSKGRVEVLHTTTVLLTGRIADEVRTVGEQALVSNMDHNDVSRGTRKNCPRPEPEETLNLIDRFKCLARICMSPMFVKEKRKRIAMMFIDLALERIAKVLKTEEVAVALDDSDGNDDMDPTICEYALKRQLDQENVAKSGMGCPRVKRKVEVH
ncbi:hypothetical protein NL676_030609 [Syzygium grande]|nr:hypothetical protein NL676_030609 [Syzygium grande]